MFVTTHLVAGYFAARNKEDMIEGFFAGQFVNFFQLGTFFSIL